MVYKVFELFYFYDILVFVIISIFLMFDNGFKLFIKEIFCIGGNDLFDEFMVYVFVKVKVEFF